MDKKILNQVKSYYSNKVIENGATPAGVDWNSIESQTLRFEVLSQVINRESDFSILDFGCGFGSMYEYFKDKYKNFHFTGFDISDEMIANAKELFDDSNTNWITELEEGQKFDFCIASGIFNVKLENDQESWKKYILETINKLNGICEEGFSFNVLTKYSDAEYMKDYLYYADPLFLFDYCKRNFSRNVALLHDYELYEFTIIVRK